MTENSVTNCYGSNSLSNSNLPEFPSYQHGSGLGQFYDSVDLYAGKDYSCIVSKIKPFCTDCVCPDCDVKC